MKFSEIKTSISKENQAIAQVKFSQLLAELGLRKNNEFVGSGLGGNNFQLLVLMSLPHTLGHGTGISVKPDGIVWGENLLVAGTMKQIRYVLDAEFPKIREAHKYIALVMDSLTKSDDFLSHYEENKEHFPKVEKAFASGTYSKLHNLTPSEQLILANLICVRLANELDNGSSPDVSAVGKVLEKFPPEVILMSVRRFIGINRIVKYDLDEDPFFGPALDKVTNLVDRPAPILRGILEAMTRKS